MKKFIGKLAIFAATAMLATNAMAADKGKNQCDHLYIGKAVSWAYTAKIRDFWLGDKDSHETAYGVVTGVGKGVVSVKVTNLSWDVQHQPTVPNIGHIYEYSCSKVH